MILQAMGFMLVALRQDLARLFNSEMQVHCTKYFQMTFVKSHFREFTRSTDFSNPLE